MRRRDFLLVATMLAGVSRARAEQAPRAARIAWLAHGDTMPRHFFDDALAKLGWVEGQNLTVKRRFVGAVGEQLDMAAKELVAWHPDAIVALGTTDAEPLVALTRTIPIVVIVAPDPVGKGLAASLARPGGNVTGTASITGELQPKLIELAHELIPEATTVSVIGDPRNPGYVKPPTSISAAPGLKINIRHASRPEELDEAFAAAADGGDGAVAVQFGALTFEERQRITALAIRYRIPTVYPLREYVEAGGLLSYGPVIRYNFERAAVLVDKLLRGSSPADLPIEQPTKFELVINQQTAKAIGVGVPEALLARADEVLE